MVDVPNVPPSLRQPARFGYNGARMIEVRNGSNEVDMQLYHGTQYIDELVGARLPDGYAEPSRTHLSESGWCNAAAPPVSWHPPGLRPRRHRPFQHFHNDQPTW